MCIYILESYKWYSYVPKAFICCCSGRDSCMLPSPCMLPSLHSAPYPALCPCEPRCPVGDTQAVSCGARSRQWSRLLPASSSQPRSIVERECSGPMDRGHIYIDICFAQERRPPLAEFSTAPVMRRTQRRTAVWGGRGATARWWEAKWSSGVPRIFWVYYNKTLLKD